MHSIGRISSNARSLQIFAAIRAALRFERADVLLSEQRITQETRKSAGYSFEKWRREYIALQAVPRRVSSMARLMRAFRPDKSGAWGNEAITASRTERLDTCIKSGWLAR